MEPENKLQSKTVETYADDMAGAIDTSESGMVKKIILQEEEYEKERKSSSVLSWKNRLFILASIILMLAACGIVWYVIRSKKEIGTVDVTGQYTPIIFTDKTAFLEVAGLSKEKIGQTFANEVTSTDVKAQGVEGIYLTENKNIVGLSRFLAMIGSALPQNITGTFADNFLLGASNQATKDPFILLQVQSFTAAFNEMRIWEPDMYTDLHDFFGTSIGANAPGTLYNNFQDGIVQNKNARILYDSNNNIVLMYVFVDNTSIVITDTEATANEIMLRLAASQVKK